MKPSMQSLVLVLISPILVSCASGITTAGSPITTVYDADHAQVVDALVIVVNGMTDYTITFKEPNQAIVKYDPPRITMGSASVRVDFIETSGTTNEDVRVEGIEIVYTDVTGLFSQDTTFSGGDVIDRLIKSFNDYARFARIDQHQVLRD